MRSELNQEPELELRAYATVLWRWWWLLVIGTVLAASTAFFVSQGMEPVYQASTTLLVNQAGNPAPLGYDIASGQLVKTYAELLTKRPVLVKVAAKLGLEGEFPADISVCPVRDTQLLAVSVEDEDPQLAADIANTLPQVFIEQNEDLQASRYADAKETLSEQMAVVQRDIESTQLVVEKLKGSDDPEDHAELGRLRSALTQYQNIHSNLFQSYTDLRLAEIESTDTLVVVEPAKVPTSPVRPRVRQNVLLAGVVGAMLAVGVAFLIEYLDDTIKTSEDVSQTLGLPTLGAIPRFRSTEDGGGPIVAARPRSSVSEAYRTLRTNIQFSTVGTPPKALLVTSAEPLEGKSFVAANLAVAIAEAGLSVILVDSDLRKGKLYQLFGLMKNSRGLTDALLRETPELQEYLQETAIKGLRILTSGSTPPNPSELLGSQRMQKLVPVLREAADVVIFDSPPVLAVTDAAVMASVVDSVLLVIEAGGTRRAAAREAEGRLAAVGAKMGAVLNFVPPRDGYYSHYY